MLRTQECPSSPKQAHITPLKKISNPKQAGDYRPIPLLHHVGKLAEQIILSKLKSGVHGKINNCQFAYRENHSTTDALLTIVNDWCIALDDQKTNHIPVTMVDMPEAFGRMHPDNY